MAWGAKRSGDRLSLAIGSGSVIPKNFGSSYIVAWASSLAIPQTVPLVGDLVKQDTTAGLNDGVRMCAANDVPQGMVWSVNSGNGTLSILKLSAIRQINLENNGAISLGDNVVADGSLGTILFDGIIRNRVKRDNTNGVGVVVALYPATGTVLSVTVEFPSGLRGV
jgi:hypothetical protein